MSLVLDCSATMAWVYGDETTEAIRFQMEQQGISRKDLEPMIGTRTRRRSAEP